MNYQIIGQAVATMDYPVLTQHNYTGGAIEFERWTLGFIDKLKEDAHFMALVALWKPKKIKG